MSLLDKASLIVTPNAYKESKLYSVVPNTTLGDMDVVRATTATRVNSLGLIEVVPRNLLGYSQQFNNAYWNKINLSIVPDSITAPNGTLTASTYIPTASPSQLTANTILKQTANITYTFSFYIKSAGLTDIRCFIWGSANTNRGEATFNVVNGSVSAIGSVGGFSNTSATINLVNNGYYLCTITTTSDTSAGVNVNFRYDNTISGASGFYIWGAQLEEGSTATEYFPTTTRLNIPRIDYTNGSCPSLLVEPQRTNVTTESETITASTGTTVTLNNTISPDGTQNADKLVEDTSTGVHITVLGGSLGGSVDSSVYSVSVFAKADGRSRIRIFDNNQSTAGSTDFNISSGVVISGAGKIKNYGNGWYRCIIFPAKTNSTNSNCQIRLLDNSGNVSYTGNGTSGVFLWGKQIEEGAYATSYVRTLASSVTRNADVISKTGISSLIGQTEGTVFVDINVDLSYTQTDMRFINISDGTSTNWWFIGTNVSNQIRFYYKTGATTYVSQLITLTSGRHKLAFAYKSNDYVAYVDGTQVHSLTSLIVGATSQIDLGNNFGGSGVSKQFINSAQLYKTRLTNAEIASLTTL